MEHLYIVIWRLNDTAKWRPEPDGVFESRRLADNLLEIKASQGSSMQYAIVEGPIVSAEAMAEAESKLGAF